MLGLHSASTAMFSLVSGHRNTKDSIKAITFYKRVHLQQVTVTLNKGLPVFRISRQYPNILFMCALVSRYAFNSCSRTVSKCIVGALSLPTASTKSKNCSLWPMRSCNNPIWILPSWRWSRLAFMQEPAVLICWAAFGPRLSSLALSPNYWSKIQ